MWGLMSQQSKVTTLLFRTTTSNETYIDLSSAMTAANRNQYHQFTRKGVPLCYEVTIEAFVGSSIGSLTQVITANNNWTVRNACVKTSAAWKKQLKDAGIRMKDLSKYGRRLRIPLDAGMSTSGTGGMTDDLVPYGASVVDASVLDVFEEYTTPSGEVVNYGSSAEFTRFTIPDEAGGDSVEMNLALLGFSGAVAANNYFGVVDEYLGSRGGVIDEPASGQQTPDADNLLIRMFSSAQPSTDEIIESVEDYQEFRPYPDGELDATATPPTASNLPVLAMDWGFVMSPATLTAGDGAAVSALTIKAPLGLIRLNGNANKDAYRITVHAIYEM
jgi:hypothetical protein